MSSQTNKNKNKKKKKNKTKKFIKKMVQFPESDIHEYGAFAIIQKLYFIHLLHTHNSKCLTKILNILIASSTSSTDFAICLEKSLKASRKYFDKILNPLVKCIESGVETIVIMLNVSFHDDGHANVLIYRKNTNIIEHYDPHGAYFHYDSQRNPDMETRLILAVLLQFINELNYYLKLNNNNHKDIAFSSSDETCPLLNGFQNLESINRKEKLEIEGGGYCAAWSLFFIESVLNDLKKTSAQIHEKLWNRFRKGNKLDKMYLLKFIRGYVNEIYTKILFDFNSVTTNNWTLKEMIRIIDLAYTKKNASLPMNDLSKITELKNYRKHLWKSSEDIHRNIIDETDVIAKHLTNLKKSSSYDTSVTNSSDLDTNSSSKGQRFVKSYKTKLFIDRMVHIPQNSKIYKSIDNLLIKELYMLHMIHKNYKQCHIKSPLTIHYSCNNQSNCDEIMFQKNKKHFITKIKEIKQCLDRSVDIIILPVMIWDNKIGYLNVLIYRQINNTIEHYEPLEIEHKSIIISNVLSKFIDLLNNELGNDNSNSIRFVSSNQVCPKMYFQKKDDYCSVWNLFFIEAVLKNPDLLSEEVNENLYKIFKAHDNVYLTNFLNNYIHKIYLTITNNFNMTTAENWDIDEILRVSDLITANKIPDDESDYKKYAILYNYYCLHTIINGTIINHGVSSYNEFKKIYQPEKGFEKIPITENDFENNEKYFYKNSDSNSNSNNSINSSLPKSQISSPHTNSVDKSSSINDDMLDSILNDFHTTK